MFVVINHHLATNIIELRIMEPNCSKCMKNMFASFRNFKY